MLGGAPDFRATPLKKSLVETPRRDILPGLYLRQELIVGFICVAGSARIGNAVLLRHRGGDETKRVAAHIDVGHCLIDQGHMTVDALGVALAVMCMCDN